MSKIVCQMYGLRHEIVRDPVNCFQKVADMGFEYIQLDGMRGLPTEQIKDAVDKAGLKVDSMHIKHNRFISDVEGIIDEARLFDCDQVYLKYIDDEFQVEYGYKFTRYALVRAVRQLEEAGIKVGFHSPEYDFNTTIDDMKVMDYICADTEGITIHPEPDTYWLSVAEVDPVSYISKYPNKILTIHFKDINKSLDLNDMKNNLEPCGKGDVDFESIIRWGEANGIESYAIEQDSSRTNIFDDMEYSFKYITDLKAKVTE